MFKIQRVSENSESGRKDSERLENLQSQMLAAHVAAESEELRIFGETETTSKKVAKAKSDNGEHSPFQRQPFEQLSQVCA